MDTKTDINRKCRTCFSFFDRFKRHLVENREAHWDQGELENLEETHTTKTNWSIYSVYSLS